MDIFFYEVFKEEQQLLSHHLSDLIDAGFSSKTIQESGHETPPSRVISTRTQSIIPDSWGKELDVIITRSTGYDHMLDLHQSNKGIQIGYLPLYCERAVAEQAMMLWMSLLRKVKKQISNFNNFSRDGITGSECRGKNLLVVGVGNIGSEVCKIGQGLEMNVRGVDIVEKYDFFKYTSIEDGMKWADIIVCSMNLTTENTGYFSREKFNLSERCPIFINISRGECSPSRLLLEMIRNGKISGLGLDVYDNEPFVSISLRERSSVTDVEMASVRTLMKREDCILTPHNAFNTRESTVRKAKQTIEQFMEYRNNGKLKWKI